LSITKICCAQLWRNYGELAFRGNKNSRKHVDGTSVLLKAFGAKLVLTPASKGMGGAIAKAEEITATQNGFLFQQFNDPDNPKTHRETTGPEIWEDTDGNVRRSPCLPDPQN
jgi:hypothetical protein